VTIFVFLVLGVIAVKDKSNQKEAGGGIILPKIILPLIISFADNRTKLKM